MARSQMGEDSFIMANRYFTEEYAKVLEDIFKLGIDRVDIHVHKEGIVITSVMPDQVEKISKMKTEDKSMNITH